MTLKELGRAYTEYKYRNSTAPLHARPSHTFSDNSANNLTKAILVYFELKGIKAWRQASEGRHIAEKRQTNVIGQSIVVQKGKYIPRTKAGKGSGDITATIPPLGRRLEVEVKFGKDRQSEDQKQFQKEIEAMGALYIIVRTWEDFWTQINNIVTV